jgi:predicted nucleic acid-binding protein
MVAPRLWAYEIRNVVLMAIRRGRISRSDGEQFLLSLNDFRVRLSEPGSYDALFSLALANGLTVYDAAYLDIAIREDLPPASLDRDLVRAAEKLGITTFQPSI